MTYGDYARKSLLAFGLAALVGGVAACEEQTPAEKMGEAIEEGGEQLGEAVEDAGKALENQ